MDWCAFLMIFAAARPLSRWFMEEAAHPTRAWGDIAGPAGVLRPGTNGLFNLDYPSQLN
jgi:hypothetical protein